MMRTAVTDTSIAAHQAHRASGQMCKQEHAILGFISQQGGDWSIGELAHALALEKSTVSARVNELRKGGFLVLADKRKDRRSGITINPVKLPCGQRELFNA